MTTLILHGYETITFGVDSIQAATSGYYVPADTIDVHESERESIVYSDTRYGGSAVSTRLNLAPFTFTCFVWGTTRSEMLDRAKTLARIVNNEGMVEYKPTDASISTYYDYVKSVRPTRANINKNQWDDINKDSDRYVMAFEVNLQTKPIGHSNSYTALFTNSNKQTGYYFALADIIGDTPAILELTMGTFNENLSKMYLFTRSETLATLSNLQSLYEAINYDTNSGTWAVYGLNYAMRSTGDSTWQRLTFDINNEPDHRGLIGFVIVARTENTDVEFRMRFEADGVVLYTSPDTYKLSEANKWLLQYCGEFTLPKVAISDNIDYSNLSFSIECKGTGNIDIMNVHLLFADEYIMEIDIDSTPGGATSENVIVSSTNDYKRIVQMVNGSGEISDVPYRVYGSQFIGVLQDCRLYTLFQGDTDYFNPANTGYFTIKAKYRTIYPFS